MSRLKVKVIFSQGARVRGFVVVGGDGESSDRTAFVLDGDVDFEAASQVGYASVAESVTLIIATSCA